MAKKKTRRRTPTQPDRSNARARKRRRKPQLRTLLGKAGFLQLYAQHGNISRACQQITINRATVYEWLEDDAEFKALYDLASDDASDALEYEARRRGVEGTLKPVYQMGKRVGTIREFSDSLLITLLKGKRPEVFRERFEHSGPGGKPLAGFTPVAALSTPELKAELAALLEKL